MSPTTTFTYIENNLFGIKKCLKKTSHSKKKKKKKKSLIKQSKAEAISKFIIISIGSKRKSAINMNFKQVFCYNIEIIINLLLLCLVL